MADTHVPGAAYAEVAAEFTEKEVGALLSLILTINAWNTIGVAARAWEPGSYEP
jgi:alkylhydroperoxidase family enzyme